MTEPGPADGSSPPAGSAPGEPSGDGTDDTITHRLLAASGLTTTPRRTELRRLADAARAVIDRLVGTEAPDDVIAAVTSDLEAAAARLVGYHQGTLYGFAESAKQGDPEAMFDHSPFMGSANPLAPPLTLHPVEGRIVGRVTFGAAYEGPPGCVHGGYVAGVFDELLGATQSLSGAPGMTGTLTVRYESPTPLNTELRLEGELDHVDGRKIFTVGRMVAGGRLTATATGLFISLREGRFNDLLIERQARQAKGG